MTYEKRGKRRMARGKSGKKMWLSGAIKHPGALTAAAKRRGVSTMQEAMRESHSSNPHIRGRGLLGMRLIKRSV